MTCGDTGLPVLACRAVYDSLSSPGLLLRVREVAVAFAAATVWPCGLFWGTNVVGVARCQKL